LYLVAAFTGILPGKEDGIGEVKVGSTHPLAPAVSVHCIDVFAASHSQYRSLTSFLMKILLSYLVDRNKISLINLQHFFYSSKQFSIHQYWSLSMITDYGSRDIG